MSETYHATLLVNKKAIQLNPFVEEFLARTSVGAVAALKGVDYIRNVEIHHAHDDISVKVNDDEVSLTPFPVMIIGNTLKGLISTLKGGNDIKTFSVTVKITY